MQFFHLYADGDGESRWQDRQVRLAMRTFAPPAEAIEISESVPARSMLFLRLRAGWDEAVHATPIRQTLICLKGRVRVTASDGTIREVGPGDVWKMEDTAGKGHHTRVTSAEDFEAVIVQHD